MVLPSNTLLVNLCAKIYEHDVDPADWDHLDLGLDDGVYWAVKKYLDYIVVVFRGSITPVDWIRDMMAVPVMTDIGRVHSGFYIGTEKMWSEIKVMLPPLLPVVVTGHSLGASHANMLCGHMIRDGIIPAKRMVVGEPKPGMEDFCQRLRVIPIQFSFINSSAHRHDIVTDVPFALPPLFPFTRPTPGAYVFGEPVGNFYDRDIDPFALHHIALYSKGVAAFDQSIKQGIAA